MIEVEHRDTLKNVYSPGPRIVPTGLQIGLLLTGDILKIFGCFFQRSRLDVMLAVSISFIRETLVTFDVVTIQGSDNLLCQFQLLIYNLKNFIVRNIQFTAYVTK